MINYDINDPTDLDIMRSQFDRITPEEWDEYIELANAYNLGFKRINILRSTSRKAGISKYLSPKVIHWVLSIIADLDERMNKEEEE